MRHRQAVFCTAMHYASVGGPCSEVNTRLLCGMQEAATLLGEAAKVKLTVAGGKVTVAGPTNKAVVVIPDVKAGKSIVHVIDTVVSGVPHIAQGWSCWSIWGL